MEQRIRELRKRVYYGDIDPHKRKDEYEIYMDATLIIRRYFGAAVLDQYIEYTIGTDEYGANYIDGVIRIVLPDSYREKDFYIP